MPNFPNPNNIPEEQLKLLQSQYADWISHPNTQMLVQWLEKRKKHYVDKLMEHILRTSDKEIEDKHRASISTIEIVSRIVTEPALFIEHTTKRQEPK